MLLWNTQRTHIYNKLRKFSLILLHAPCPPPLPKQANKNNNSSWTEKEIYLQPLDLNTWSFDLILCMSKWRLSVKACPGCNPHFKMQQRAVTTKPATYAQMPLLAWQWYMKRRSSKDVLLMTNETLWRRHMFSVKAWCETFLHHVPGNNKKGENNKQLKTCGCTLVNVCAIKWSTFKDRFHIIISATN